jgi:hypothetical protein
MARCYAGRDDSRIIATEYLSGKDPVMSNLWQRSNPIDPGRLLEAVAALGPDLAAFTELGALVASDQSGWRLHWPARNEKTSNAALAALSQALDIDVLPADPGFDPVNHQRFGLAALAYITNRDLSDEADMKPDPGHSLVVAYAVDREKACDIIEAVNRAQARSIVENIYNYSTMVRACIFRHDGEPVALLHARDDPQRGSSLRSVIAAGALKSAPVLLPYQTNAGTVFLRRSPPVRAMAATAELYRSAPALFDVATTSSGRTDGSKGDPAANMRPRHVGPMLFAFDDRVTFDLRAIRFVGSSELVPQSERPQIEMKKADPRKAEESLAELRSWLKSGRGGFASTLHLRMASEDVRLRKTNESAGSRDVADDIGQVRELDTIRREIAKLRREERRLVAGEAPRLRLLRCRNDSFAALASTLRQVHAAGLEDEKGIRYGRDVDPAGELCHYVLFEKSAAAVQARDPDFPAGSGVDWFWSDPVWSKHYLKPGQSAAERPRLTLFVPHGTALEPFPHAWDREEFDAYLAANIASWSKDAVNLRADMKAVVIFERATGDRQARLRVTVLPDRTFCPLTPETVAWINDVGVILPPVPDWGSLSGPSAALIDTSLLQRMHEQAHANHVTAAASLDAARARVAAEVEAVLEQFASYVHSLVETGASHRAAISAQEQQVAELGAQYEGIKAAVGKIQQSHASILASCTTAKVQHDANSKAVLGEIDQVAARIRADSAAVDAKIKAMDQEVNAIRLQIKAVRLW